MNLNRYWIIPVALWVLGLQSVCAQEPCDTIAMITKVAFYEKTPSSKAIYQHHGIYVTTEGYAGNPIIPLYLKFTFFRVTLPGHSVFQE